MPSFGGVLLSYFCTVGGKNSSNHSNIHNKFPRFFFPDSIMIQLNRSLCDFKLPNVPLKKIELRCLEDVLFSVMSMGKERTKSPTRSNLRFEVCWLVESFFFSLSTAMRKQIHVTPQFIPRQRPKLSSFLFYLLK